MRHPYKGHHFCTARALREAAFKIRRNDNVTVLAFVDLVSCDRTRACGFSLLLLPFCFSPLFHVSARRVVGEGGYATREHANERDSPPSPPNRERVRIEGVRNEKEEGHTHRA